MSFEEFECEPPPLDYPHLVSRIQWYYQQLVYQSENVEDKNMAKAFEQLRQIYLSVFDRVVFIKEFE